MKLMIWKKIKIKKNTLSLLSNKFLQGAFTIPHTCSFLRPSSSLRLIFKILISLTTKMLVWFRSLRLMTRISRIELSECGCRNSFEHLLGEDTKKLPADVKRFEHRAVFVRTLRDEVFLKLGKELEVEQVIRCQSFFTDNSLHSLDVFSDGVAGVLKKFFRIIFSKLFLGKMQNSQKKFITELLFY